MSDIYRTNASKECSNCARPLDVIECFQYGVPGHYCSPKCIDDAVKRQRPTSAQPKEMK